MAGVDSRVPGAHELSPVQRARLVADRVGLSENERATLGSLAADASGPNSVALAADMVENCIGVLGVPLGVAMNFTIDGVDRFVPMAIEEPSVVAAASNAAKMARIRGGFTTEAIGNLMIGQVHLLGVRDIDEAVSVIRKNRDQLIATAEPETSSLRDKGGGVHDLEVRILHIGTPSDGTSAPNVRAGTGTVVVVHLLVDCLDAMGANAVNTRCERVAPLLEKLTGGKARLRILSNLSDKRMVRAQAVFDAEALGAPGTVDRILEAQWLAEVDPYRAATHNKGVMNGVDAVVLATGNDWRAVEAGAHAWAAHSGVYGPLTRYQKTPDGHLAGELTMPLALGSIGGATKVHPVARLALAILQAQGATDVARVAAAVGLAQNLAALRALATEGIQQGHMRLHSRLGGRT